MQKIYCYVDETGQDTKGNFFLVTVVVLDHDRETLQTKLESIEQISRKGTRKWFHTNKVRRQQYIRELIASGAFTKSLFYSKYEDGKSYLDLTIFTTAKAILQKAQHPYETTIIVDGLLQSEWHRFAAGLRRLNIEVRKVRGGREQGDPLLRLADAIAGFVRDAIEGDEVMVELYKQGMSKDLIEEI